MSLYNLLLNLFLHLDTYLAEIVGKYGLFTYLILFLIIFLETGIVVMPFLPGDSLIFVAGTLAAQKILNVFLLFFILSAAAILGDTVNYWIGKYLGESIEKRGFIKKRHLDRTYKFYEKHGGKTIVLARFVPIIRTIAPFVAGVGKMNYVRFLAFNLIGGFIWVGFFTLAGYFFGTIPWVKENLTVVVISIIILSIIPAVVEFLRHRKEK